MWLRVQYWRQEKFLHVMVNVLLPRYVPVHAAFTWRTECPETFTVGFNVSFAPRSSLLSSWCLHRHCWRTFPAHTLPAIVACPFLAHLFKRIPATCAPESLKYRKRHLPRWNRELKCSRCRSVCAVAQSQRQLVSDMNLSCSPLNHVQMALLVLWVKEWQFSLSSRAKVCWLKGFGAALLQKLCFKKMFLIPILWGTHEKRRSHFFLEK